MFDKDDDGLISVIILSWTILYSVLQGVRIQRDHDDPGGQAEQGAGGRDGEAVAWDSIVLIIIYQIAEADVDGRGFVDCRAFTKIITGNKENNWQTYQLGPNHVCVIVSRRRDTITSVWYYVSRRRDT